MATPQKQTGKKKVSWLIFPFILILTLFLAKFLYPRINKIENQKKYSVAENEADYKELKCHILYTPEKLSQMMKIFNADDIGSECIRNGSDEKKENWTFNGIQYNVSSYCWNSGYAGKVTPITKVHCIELTILEKSDYSFYTSYLEKVAEDSVIKNKEYADSKHLVYNNSVFIERGLVNGYNGYCIEIYPLDKFGNPANFSINKDAQYRRDSLFNVRPL